MHLLFSGLEDSEEVKIPCKIFWSCPRERLSDIPPLLSKVAKKMSLKVWNFMKPMQKQQFIFVQCIMSISLLFVSYTALFLPPAKTRPTRTWRGTPLETPPPRLPTSPRPGPRARRTRPRPPTCSVSVRFLFGCPNGFICSFIYII